MLLAAVALTASACSSSGSTKAAVNPPAGSAPASSAPSAPAAGGSGSTGAATGAVVDVRSTSVGKILVDKQGRTLYLFEKDTGPTSMCTGACASAWPPYTTTGTPQAGPGVTAGLLGTTMRADHGTEVTYHGHPLYYFSGDSKPGDMNGQGSKAFGAGWYVVAPSGSKIDTS
jgi:predicted lipoprotein with Yx(FWY)xxD motif